LKCETGWQGIVAGIRTYVYLGMERPQLFLKTGSRATGVDNWGIAGAVQFRDKDYRLASTVF